MNTTRTLIATPASSIKTEKISWLFDCWVPRSSVVLLAGREGIGKSTIAVSFVADVTTGKVGDPMNVGYVVTEDSRSLTVVPRLVAAGADLDRVLFIDAQTSDEDDDGNTITTDSVLDLPADFPLLEDFIVDNELGMVILDAAKSVMSSRIDGNSDTGIRQFLEPMSRIAQKHDMVFIGLAHFGKKESADTGKLIIGSSAWSQVARSVISVAKHPEEEMVRVWNSKANLAPRIRSVDARIISSPIPIDDGTTAEVGRVEWLGEVDEDGSSFLDAETIDQDERTEIEKVLFSILEAEPLPANEVYRQLNEAGYSKDQAKRAKKKLRIKAVKNGTKGWKWLLPHHDEGSTPTPTRIMALPSRNSAPFEVTGGAENAPLVLQTVEGSEGSKGAREGTVRTLHPEGSPHARYEAIFTAVSKLGSEARAGKIQGHVYEVTGHAEDVPDLLAEMVSAQLLVLDGNTYRKAA